MIALSTLLYSVELLIVFVFVLGLSAAETAFSIVKGDNLERIVQRRSAGARRLEALQEKNTSVMISLLMTKTVLIVSFIVISIDFGKTLYDGPWGEVLSAAAGLVIVLVTQTIGQLWGTNNPESIALRFTGPVSAITKALSPLVKIVTSLAIPPITKLLGKKSDTNGNGNELPNLETVETLGTDNESSRNSEDNELGRQIMRGALRLESMSVKEIMVPRPDIISIATDKTVREGIEVVLNEGYSRIPLYHETIDNIRGVVYAKDLLAVSQKEPAANLASVARSALLIPETKKLGSLLREFQEKRIQIALVIDEYGSLSGLVTNEDLLEEIVGDIEDEFTVAEPIIEQINEDTAIIDARAPLQYVNDLFKVDLEAEGSATLGGLIYDRLARMPHPGDIVEDEQVRIRVLTTSGRRIRRVRVNRLNTQQSGSSNSSSE
ncbi:MAG: hemolysin family protein [Chloroflexota bacterium]|nr:hemolysin family protein [Chloroflexota bacterium]